MDEQKRSPRRPGECGHINPRSGKPCVLPAGHEEYDALHDDGVRPSPIPDEWVEDGWREV